MSKSNAAEKLFESEDRPMTEADRIKVGAELAEVDRMIIAVKEEKRSVNSAYRVRLNKLEERADVLSKQLTDGVVEIKFEVREVYDDERMVVDIERADTGKRTGSRPMTEPEKEAARKRKQRTMPGIVDDDYMPPDPEMPKPRGARARRAKR
jgi:hypothetical protein